MYTFQRTEYDTIEEIKALPDGTTIMLEFAYQTSYTPEGEKTPDGILLLDCYNNEYKLFSWKKLRKNWSSFNIYTQIDL